MPPPAATEQKNRSWFAAECVPRAYPTSITPFSQKRLSFYFNNLKAPTYPFAQIL
jgi:hypothetical protein